MKTVRVLFLLVAGLAPWPTLSAEPPVFTEATRQAVTGMSPLTQTPLPALQGKVVVVSFFASWCPPCTDEFRQLNRLGRAFPADKVAIVALNLFEGFFADNRKPRMRRFLKRTAPAFPVLGGMDDDRLSALFGGVERIPTVFIFDRRGRPVFTFIHEVNATKMHAGYAELHAAIRPLLAEP